MAAPAGHQRPLGTASASTPTAASPIQPPLPTYIYRQHIFCCMNTSPSVHPFLHHLLRTSTYSTHSTYIYIQYICCCETTAPPWHSSTHLLLRDDHHAHQGMHQSSRVTGLIPPSDLTSLSVLGKIHLLIWDNDHHLLRTSTDTTNTMHSTNGNNIQETHSA